MFQINKLIKIFSHERQSKTATDSWVYANGGKHTREYSTSKMLLLGIVYYEALNTEII